MLGKAHARPGVGYHLGVMLGTRVALTDQFGLCAEFGHVRRGTSVTVVMEPEAGLPRTRSPQLLTALITARIGHERAG